MEPFVATDAAMQADFDKIAAAVDLALSRDRNDFEHKPAVLQAAQRFADVQARLGALYNALKRKDEGLRHSMAMDERYDGDGTETLAITGALFALLATCLDLVAELDDADIAHKTAVQDEKDRQRALFKEVQPHARAGKAPAAPSAPTPRRRAAEADVATDDRPAKRKQSRTSVATTDAQSDDGDDGDDGEPQPILKNGIIAATPCSECVEADVSCKMRVDWGRNKPGACAYCFAKHKGGCDATWRCAEDVEGSDEDVQLQDDARPIPEAESTLKEVLSSTGNHLRDVATALQGIALVLNRAAALQ